jgi:hypothetical protein
VDLPGIFRVRIAFRLEPIGRLWEDNHPVGESPSRMTSRDRWCSLLSDDAAMISGGSLPVDGGYTGR